MLKYLGLIICVVFINSAIAQTISGSIMDKESGKAIQGASISIANTNKGTVVMKLVNIVSRVLPLAKLN